MLFGLYSSVWGSAPVASPSAKLHEGREVAPLWALQGAWPCHLHPWLGTLQAYAKVHEGALPAKWKVENPSQFHNAVSTGGNSMLPLSLSIFLFQQCLKVILKGIFLRKWIPWPLPQWRTECGWWQEFKSTLYSPILTVLLEYEEIDRTGSTVCVWLKKNLRSQALLPSIYIF